MQHCLKPVVAALIALPAFAGASNAPVLPEVKVSSGGFTQEERATATSTHVIDRRSIENSNAQNLSELLLEQGFAVEATPNDHGENTLVLRGFQTEHLNTEANGNLLILIDGRRSGVANVRQIMVGNIERVEVLRGPEMFKYAMGSPGGVINVVTRRGGPKRFGGSVHAGYGSFDAWRAGANVHGQADGFDYSLGYERSAVRDDYRDGRGKTVHNTSTKGTESFNFNLGYTFADRHRIGIDGYQYTVDKAHRPSYIDEEGEIRDQNYTDRETQLVHLNYEGESESGQLSWRASVGQGKDLYETYSGSLYPKGQEVKSDRALASLTYTADRFDVTGGFDYIQYDVSNSSSARGAFLGNPATGLDPVWRGKGFPMHKTSQTTLWGGYLVGTWKLMDGALNISGGLRYEEARAKDLSVGDEHFDRVPYFNSRGISRDQLPTSRNFSHLSPSIGVTYLPADWVKLRANYTQGWRAPSGRQLFASSFYEDYGAPGDPRLNPEETDAFEVGFDLAQRDWRLSATYFHYEVKDNIYIYPGVRDNGVGAQGRVVQNMDRRVQEGFELQGSANVTPLFFGHNNFELRPYFNVTHMMRAEEVLQEGGPGLRGTWWRITRMPDTTASVGVRFAHPDWKFSSNLNFNYYGNQISGRSNVGDALPEPYGKFWVANLSMSKRLWDAGEAGSLDLKLNINNLFDRTYAYLGKVPPTAAHPGRNVFATLTYNF